jgi:hypothetical protein
MLAMAGVITSAAFASVLTGCGASDAPTGSESDALSGPTTSSGHIEKDPPSTAAPANTIMKITPPNVIMKVNPSGPTASSGEHPTTSTAADGKCGAGEKICQFANDKGICIDRCVADYVMCAEPNCVVCDPSGPAPEPGCKWDSEACEWLCL